MRCEDVTEKTELQTGLKELGFERPCSNLAQLSQLAVFLADWGGKLNLTGHLTLSAIHRNLILESLAIGAALPPFEHLVDLGSGAGFPGLPLAICFPARRVTLVEAREKRNHFQRFIIRELGLSNVRALRGRAESLSPERGDIVLAMAMARPERAIAWMKDWVGPGGRLVLPLGAQRPDLVAPEGFAFEAEIEYRVPFSTSARALWVARRRR